MGLFRTLLVIVLIFYAFNLIIKMIFNRKIKKFQQGLGIDDQNDTQEQPNETKNPHIDPNIGEYTDFEEVE